MKLKKTLITNSWLYSWIGQLNGEKLSLSKREKIIVATIIITISLIFSTQVQNFIFIKSRLIIILGIVTYFISLWALWEGMTKIKAVLLLILPTLFTLAVASFYFLLPVRWLTRIPWGIGFGLAFYLLLLSQNVFNVAAIRTIPLYRVASATSFLFSVFTAFFLFNVVFALNLTFYWNGVLTFIICFFLILPILWSIQMEEITLNMLMYSFVISLLLGESALALSFWPLAPTIWSLSLATILYVILGLNIEKARDRLTKKMIWEYSTVGVIVFIFSFMATSWTG